MWVLTNKAWLSVVEDRQVPGNLLVRSRGADHIRAVFPGAKVTCNSMRDYRYRTSLPRGRVAAVLAELLMNIDYGNFKDSVADRRLHDTYMKVWQAGYAYQEYRPEPPVQAAPAPNPARSAWLGMPHTHWPRQAVSPTTDKPKRAKRKKARR